MVKTAETDDPIGIATVLSLSRHSTLGGLKELTQFILKQCPAKELRAKLEGVCAILPGSQHLHAGLHPCLHAINLKLSLWDAGLAN